MAFAVAASAGFAFAGPNTSLPFADDFERYTNGTPLNTGTNGWYASSTSVIVQVNTIYSGTNAAMIPVDCTLSNRFQSIATTNVWIQMDVQPKLYSGTNNPVVDTNQVAMFYVNSNGNFVVHNGIASNSSALPDPTNSVNWMIVTNAACSIPTNGTTWVRLNIYENYALTNWDLYVNGILVTNAIGFINTTQTTFTGFGVYNGSQTTFLDNVSVMAPVTNQDQYPLIVTPSAFATNVFAGPTPAARTANVINVWSSPVGFGVATNLSCKWLKVSPTNGTVAAGSTQAVSLTNSSTVGWLPGVSNTTLAVWSTNGSAGGRWATQTVEVLVNVMKLLATPTNITNTAWSGATPANQTFAVSNAGGGSFNYTVTITNLEWVSCSPASGTLGAYSSNVLTLTYSNMAWGGGSSSQTMVKIVSADSVGATQTVRLVYNVQAISNVLEVTPTNLTSTAWRGATPSNQTFVVRNKSDVSFNYTVATNADAGWISAAPVSGALAAWNTQTVTLTYQSTVGWVAGSTSSTWARVATTDGGGATQDVGVTVNVLAISNAMAVAPLQLSNNVWQGDTPSNRTFVVSNLSDNSFTYTVATNAAWLTASTAGGTLAARDTKLVTLTFDQTDGTWPVGTTSNSSVTVATSDGDASTKAVTVAVHVVAFDAGALVVEPGTRANTVGRGDTPPSQTFAVRNTGAVSLDYTVAVATGAWLSCSSSSGSVAPNGSNALTLTYAKTDGTWGLGDSNTTVRVVSANGSGATGTVVVTLTILGSGMMNRIPYADNFDAYAAQMALVGGVSGWYGSASSVLVQDVVATNGTKSAMIPEDCVLSNRFVAGDPYNVRITMDLRTVRADFADTNFPAVDTNAVALFYVDTNGHFVVRNGTSDWCMVSNALGSGSEFVVNNDTWTPIVIYLDYRYRNWKLKARNVLITNKIGFVTQQTNSFTGFDLYNGTSTSYLDNVTVNWWDRFKVNGVLDHLIRSVNGVVPDSRIMGVPAP